MSVNDKIYDRAVDRAALTRLYERRTQGKIEDVIDKHAGRTEVLVRSTSAKNLRSQSFLNDLSLEVDTTYDIALETSKTSLVQLVGDQVSYMVQNLEAGMGRVWRVFYPEKRVAEEIVLQRPLYKDTTLSQGWYGVSTQEKKRLEALIRRGLAEGLSESEIALQIRRGNVFNISRAQSFGLVRTAITSVQSQADHEVYEVNKKALQGYQFVAVLDSRTSPVCAYNDGKIYPIGDLKHLPPLHWNCRSTTVPVVKKWDDLAQLEGIQQIRSENLALLTDKERAMYDGMTPLKESYDEWLRRQPTEIQLRHIGDLDRLELFQQGQLKLDKFTNADGKSVGIRELRSMTDASFDAIEGTTAKFALAKEKLDAIRLGASRPDDFINSVKLKESLLDYYKLQAGELDGTLSLTTYRGTTIGSKRATKNRVLTSPPTEDNLKFNPITGRYEDARLYQPSPAVLDNSLRLMEESTDLLPRDKEFIRDINSKLTGYMGVNERAVVVDNLRITFARARVNNEPWINVKAVLNAQIKFDVMNVSDFMETQLRRDQNLLKRLKQDQYFDPVLGEVQLQELHDEFISNIFKRNRWEDYTAPRIARELRSTFDLDIPYVLRRRLQQERTVKIKARTPAEKDIKFKEKDIIGAFYKRFAARLAVADSPDRDQLAISLGRDLYNTANYRGNRREWYELGLRLLKTAEKKGFFTYDTYGVQKRRLRSKLSGNYFGPVYDTNSYYLVIKDKRIQEYAKLQRKIDVGLRLGVTTGKNRLYIRKGKKTYYDRWFRDTRIPITSSTAFSDFPPEFIDGKIVDALNWAGQAKFKIDPEFHDFIEKLLYFEDDKGKAQFYHDLNEYRKHILGRGDAYERFKAMKWLRTKDAAFSNHPYMDSRGRVYERGFIGPQSGETFRPFLITETPKPLGALGFQNLQDIIGATLGGASDYLEGRYNSLTIVGRQQIAERWRGDMIKIGYHMMRGKPNDIRAILENDFLSHVDGEEQGKILRLALELARIDQHLAGDFSRKNLNKLDDYMISLAMEQDASSSGAQIIALTTKNKQLAQLSNVVPTNQKQRLYDEIAAATYNDPRFRELNKRLNLTEKDLRKAAKAQNMVTFYGAGERTGILNVEGKLAKVLGKDKGTLVVTAKERDAVLAEIDARAARYKDYLPEVYEELKALRQDVKDVFNKGESPDLELIRQLYFLEPKTKEFVEKLSRNYDNVVTPADFAQIAKIMSENLRLQVPILKDFTRYFGRLAQEYAESTGNLNIPWKTFDGKTIEQYFPLTFEERLVYKTPEGQWVTNFIQVDQKTDPTFFDELLDRDGKMRDISDTGKARTAFAVNGNHSNDAVIVRQFHLWGRKNGIETATVHDAFFTNTADLLAAKEAIRQSYAEALKSSPIKATLDEMRSRGLPKAIYDKYLNEAIELGLIPVVGRSRVGGRLLTDTDILTMDDVLEEVPIGFDKNRGWYGIGP